MTTTVRPQSGPSFRPSPAPPRAAARRAEAGARNIRRHWLRDAVRVSVLVGADTGVFFGLRLIVRVLRDGFGPNLLAGSVAAVFPPGVLGGGRFLTALLLSLLVTGSYGTGDARRDVGRVFRASALAALIVLFDAAWDRSIGVVLMEFAGTSVVFGIALSVSRMVVDWIVATYRPRLAASRTLLVSDGVRDWLDVSMASGNGNGLKVVGRVSTSGAQPRDDYAPLTELSVLIERTVADTVIVCGPISDEDFSLVVDVAHVTGCRLLAASRTQRTAGIEPKALWLEGLPLVELTRPSLKGSQLVAKRAMDVVGSLIGLSVLSPLLAAIALRVRLDSRGPVFFGQLRLGEGGRPFRCLKFRTMRRDAEEALRKDSELHRRYVENNFKLPGSTDPRLTAAGRWLRRTSLDELPQLWNVLKGEMSLVGPRPIVPDEIEHYNLSAPLFLSLKPGVTGAWAVRGRSHVGYPDRAHMELAYVRGWSLFTDLQILLLTIPAVFSRRGAH